MKKFLSVILVLCLMVAFAGCQQSEPVETEPKEPSYSDVTACFVGDSITFGCTLVAGEKIYWQVADEALHFKNTIGMGINGSCYSTTSDYGLDNSPLVMRYQEIPQTDLIFIKLGTNDFYQKTPMGTIEDKEDISFYGAMNYCLDKITEQCPNSKIILITPINVMSSHVNKAGTKLTDYVDAVKAVGEQRGLLVMDMHNITKESLTQGFFNDSAHPNKFGQQVMGEALQKWLEENKEAILG